MLKQQQYPSPIEIINIDSGSTDGTLEIMEARGITPRRITKSEFRHSRTRNVAATLASNDVLVFISQDAIPSHGAWLKNLVQPFTDRAVGAVYGRQLPPAGMSELRKYALHYTYPPQREVREPDTTLVGLGQFRFSNANSAVRADLCRDLKFDETALVCEDHGMCRDVLEAGYKIVYEPDAAVIHGHQRDMAGEFRWSFYNGCSLKRMGILGNRGTRGELHYGLARVKAEWRHFAGRGMYLTALHGVALSAAKWVGVQLGKREELIPTQVLRAIFRDYRRGA